ncbi:hypothetical protein M8S10_20410 [Enterobacter chuandaensis]|uniref:hypothetical protein n=1 Tax=Enterobacter chuandaensis TaxID=2497875 RepID=UPI002074FA69|nr:hypothetical protein [Enterobacter chuandaensis]MCM7591168.1 hypothetical protein [Enterobacter chuandaensis]
MKKHVFVIAILLTLTQSSLAAPRLIEAGSYNLKMSGRPDECFPHLGKYNSSLTATGEGAEYPVKLSRHHIIPYNLLRDFYNAVIEDGKITRLAGFLNKLSSKAAEYNATNCHSDDVQGGASLAAMIASGSITENKDKTESPDYKDDFFSLYIWMPGNLFPGPESKKRSDDPNEAFESKAGDIVGSDFTHYQQLANDMNDYINSHDEKILSGINDNLEFIANKTTSYPLVGTKWEKTGEKYRLK